MSAASSAEPLYTAPVLPNGLAPPVRLDTTSWKWKVPQFRCAWIELAGMRTTRVMVSRRTGGASPFGNTGAVYSGSADDAALNAGVLRYRADAQAVQRFAADTDPTGRIPVPVLSTKWISDPTAFVELDAYFKGVMDSGGSGARLVQTFTREGTHSYISDPTYPTLLAALLRWVDTGSKPTAAEIAQQCPGQEAQFGAGCSFVPDYVPAALDTRVVPRDRP